MFYLNSIIYHHRDPNYNINHKDLHSDIYYHTDTKPISYNYGDSNSLSYHEGRTRCRPM